MPWSFPGNIPRPARNWTESEKRKCVTAANAVLRDGGSDQDATFACIRAAGKTRNSGGKEVSRMEGTDVWVDLFNASKVLQGQPVCLIPLMESGYHRGGLKRQPITKAELASLVSNFENRATSGFYLDILPLNIEHDEHDGKIGSIQSLTLADDGAYAIFDLTPKGKAKLEEGAFSYLSPEIRWETLDVKTGEDIGPTLAGAAATNYPFWGNQTAMYSQRALDRLDKDYPIESRFARNLGVMVDQFHVLMSKLTATLEGGDSDDDGGNAAGEDVSDDHEQEVTGMTENNEELLEVAIPQDFLDRMSAVEDRAEQYGQQLQERDEMIQTQRQEIDDLNLARVRDRFTARAEGFTAIGAENGDLSSELTWLYMVDQTEEREHFTFFDALLGTLDTALADSEAFRESGRSGEQLPSDAFAQIDGLVAKKAKERNVSALVGSEMYNELIQEVLHENPSLYDQHRQALTSPVSRVGR